MRRDTASPRPESLPDVFRGIATLGSDLVAVDRSLALELRMQGARRSR